MHNVTASPVAAAAANDIDNATPGPTPKGAFDKTLEAKTERASAVDAIGRVVDNIRREETRLDHAMHRMSGGRELDSVELLRVQSLMYDHVQRVELASKVVESATSGLKQMLNTQV